MCICCCMHWNSVTSTLYLAVTHVEGVCMRRLLYLALLATFSLLLSALPVPQVYAASLVYISPPPFTSDVSAYTAIAIRADEPLEESSVQPARFRVTGSQSGLHAGRAVLSHDHGTALFYPDQPFTPQEQVTVQIETGLSTISGAPITGTEYTLNISPKPLADYASSTSQSLASEVPASAADAALPADSPVVASQTTYKTLPITLPYWSILTNKTGVGSGYVFFTPLAFYPFTYANPMMVIVDNSGELVYYKNEFSDDYKVQPDGTQSYYSFIQGCFVVMDNTYTTKRLIKAGNGYVTDNHELQMIPGGNALLMIYNNRTADLTAIGGLSNATVQDLIIQEIDPDDNVVFEWNSKDYIAVADTYQPIANQTTIDYIHGNAIELDDDGNLLISSRHTSEITKINRSTGQVIWRLGGKSNQFTFLNSDMFYYQHDIRRLDNGNISLFNNRSNKTPIYSRAEEYTIDEVNKTVSLTWSYQTPLQAYSFAMGNAQRLSNGNTVIGWGSGVPILTEVTSAGEVVFELALEAPLVSYRAFRFPWVGHPTTQPALVAELENTKVAVYTSWNGATEVASWRVEAGLSHADLSVITTQPRTGFETRIPLSGMPTNTCYFRTTALDSTGAVLGQSPVTFGHGPGCPDVAPTYIYAPIVVQ